MQYDPAVVSAFSLDPMDAAYFAGLIDGEGCIRIYKLKHASGIHYNLAVRVVMARPECVEYLALHTQEIGGQAQLRQDKNGPLYRWEITAERASVFLKAIMPYLREKKVVAERALAYQGIRKSLSKDEQDEFHMQIRDLNATRKPRGETKRLLGD
jgi:hypothetical protein